MTREFGGGGPAGLLPNGGDAARRRFLADVAFFARLRSSSGTVCPIFFRVSFFGWTVDRTRVTARLLGLNGDSNGGNVGHRSIFCDFVSRCSVFLPLFECIFARFCILYLPFFAIFCRYILGEFERI